MELDVHTNYWIIQHLFWNVALKHGCIFQQKTFGLRKKFVFSEQNETHFLSDELSSFIGTGRR